LTARAGELSAKAMIWQRKKAEGLFFDDFEPTVPDSS
jgi:hypothetical protein